MSDDKKINVRKDNYPFSVCTYTAGGKQFTVTRRFTGSKDIDTLMMEIAVRVANREMGIQG